MSVSKSGFIAIIGRPNVGKSTLLNTFLGEKISITSAKPQTTRTQILGIKTEGDNQLIFMDTPGMHRENKKAMNRYMNRIAASIAQDADLVLFMVDATSWRAEDELVVEQLKNSDLPIILVLNKIDLLKDKNVLLPLINQLKTKLNFAHIIPICAQEADNLSTLEETIIACLPEGEHYFPDDQITDKSVEFQLAELIREKLIRVTEEELPYATTVEIEDFKEEEKLIEVSAVIWVEREGQKPIVIGKGGQRLKKIGMQARREMEMLLKKKVFLRLWVKIKSDWTDNEKALRNLGYT